MHDKYCLNMSILQFVIKTKISEVDVLILNQEVCIGCGLCLSYCPVKAISLIDDKAMINDDECVECGVCLRANCCPVNAFFQEELKWPRIIRRVFSNAGASHSAGTKGWGRGTQEMKTNDVTDRFKRGQAGIALEVGRPGVGARISDIQIITTIIAKYGVEFEPENPLTYLMDNIGTGTFPEEIMNERVLSAIIEFVIPSDTLPNIMKGIEEASNASANTVFSASIITRAGEDDSLPNVETIKQLGYKVSPNAKINIGLGKRRKSNV